MNNHKKTKNWYFFAKKASQVMVKIKSELLDQKYSYEFQVFMSS